MGCVYINHFLNGLIRRQKVQKGRKAGEREREGLGEDQLEVATGQGRRGKAACVGILEAAATAAT